MITAFIQNAAGQISTDASPESLASALKDPAARLWLDMQSPTDDEVGLLDDVFGFHPLAIEDVTQEVQRAKVDMYPHGTDQRLSYFFLVIHGPDQDKLHEQVRTKELDLFMSQQYLVTVHEQPMKSITTTLARMRTDPGRIFQTGLDLLLCDILHRLVDDYQPIMDYIQSTLDHLEEEALQRPTPSVLARITIRKRELLNLRRVIGPQREVIAQLARGDIPLLPERTRVYLRDILDNLVRIIEMVELYRDIIVGARDIYLSSINNNLNEIMKTLTIFTVIALPFTVITGFFGMNFQQITGIQSPGAFWLAVGFMAASAAGMAYMFHKRKWM